jgi:hypothetical protein
MAEKDYVGAAMERARAKYNLPKDYPTPPGFQGTPGGQAVNRGGLTLDAYIARELEKKKAKEKKKGKPIPRKQ